MKCRYEQRSEENEGKVNSIILQSGEHQSRQKDGLRSHRWPFGGEATMNGPDYHSAEE